MAEEVNANFAALISAINNNAQRIEALELAGGAGGVVPVPGGSDTFISFEAQALASNCDPSD